MHGGKRAGAGRSKGSVTKKTAELAKEYAAAGISPLEFLLKVMREEITDDLPDEEKRRKFAYQVDCAKAAAPYLHPRLANVEMNANVKHSLSDELAALNAKAK